MPILWDDFQPPGFPFLKFCTLSLVTTQSICESVFPISESRHVPPAAGGVLTQACSWSFWSVSLWKFYWGWCDVSVLPSVSTFPCVPLQVCVPTTSSSLQRVSRCCWSLSSPESCCFPAHCLPPLRTRHLTPCTLYRLVFFCLQRRGRCIQGSKGGWLFHNFYIDIYIIFQFYWSSQANTVID